MSNCKKIGFSELKRQGSAFFVLLLVLFSVIGCSQIAVPEGWSGGIVYEGSSNQEVLFIGSMDGLFLPLDKATGDGFWCDEYIQTIHANDCENNEDVIMWEDPLLLPYDKDSDDGNKYQRAIYGTPAISEGVIFVPVYDGQILAISLNSGDNLGSWPRTQFKDGDFVGGLLVRDGVLYVGGGDGKVYALNFTKDEDGDISFDQKWVFSEATNKFWSSPEMFGDTLIIGSLDHNVYGIDAESGKRKWKFETDGAVASSAVVSDGVAYVGSFDGVFYAINATEGTEIWSFTGSSNWYWGKPVVSGNMVYAPSLDGSLYGLGIRDGELKWRVETKDAIVSSPAIVKDMIVFGSTDGKLYIADKVSGELLDECNIGEEIRTPIVADEEAVYFGAKDRSIRAIRIKKIGRAEDDLWESPHFTKDAVKFLIEKYDKGKTDRKKVTTRDEGWSGAC